MLDQKAVSRHVTKRVALDQGTLTYRLLSRELGLTVSEAKAFLAAYAQEPTCSERGVQITWAVSGWLKEEVKGEDRMDVDELSPSARQPSPRKRAVILVTAAKVDAVLARFDGIPSRHVYALTPAAPSATTLCSTSCLSQKPSTSASAENKWKDAPSGGWGGIVHPDGERKKAVEKGAVAAKPVAAAVKKDVKPAASSFFAKPGKSAPPARPIGQLGGLFAKRDPPPDEKKPKKEDKVLAKRKASPPPAEKTKAPLAKKVSNGIFDDEVESEEDDNEGEEAMRAAEEEAKAKRSKAVNAQMMSDDVEMAVDAPAKVAAKVAAKVKPKQQTLSFSKRP